MPVEQAKEQRPIDKNDPEVRDILDRSRANRAQEALEANKKDPNMAALATAAENAQQLEKDIEFKETELSNLKRKLQGVLCGDIPDIMNDLGMKSFTMNNGAVITVKNIYSGKVLDEESAYDVLSQLVKSTVKINFAKGDEDNLKELDNLLENNPKCKGESTSLSKGIHHLTLSSYLKELDEAGKLDEFIEQNQGVFSISVLRRAKIT